MEEEEEGQEEEEEEEEVEEEEEEEVEEKEEEDPMRQDDDNDFVNQMTEGDLKKKNSQHVVDTATSNSEDENVFKSVCGGDLRKKLAENNTFNQTPLIYTSLDHSITRRPVKVTGLLCMVIVGSHMCLNHGLSGNI